MTDPASFRVESFLSQPPPILPEDGATAQGADETTRTGCNWAPSFELPVPLWPSALYAAHCIEEQTQDDYYIVFVVRPPIPSFDVGPLRRFAVIANTNTWNAYNGWGGRSNYDKRPPVKDLVLSFERPNPLTRPAPPFVAGDSNLTWSQYSTRHLTRSEVWFHSWLEGEGYDFDVFTDVDVHLGLYDFHRYSAIILNTHPEYWSQAMRDRIKAYRDRGGRIIYLGGNGLYERVSYDDQGRMVLRQTASGERDYFSRDNQSEREILGVGFVRKAIPQPAF